MIYRELKTYETPLGMKKTARVEMCERAICGHVIFKIDLLPSMFNQILRLTGVPGLDVNYPFVRDSIVTALCGDCSDEQYISALTRIYENSLFFEAYINYHYIMRRDEIKIKELIIPLVECVKVTAVSVMTTAKGTYMAEDSGYMYILDAYLPALINHRYVAIR